MSDKNNFDEQYDAFVASLRDSVDESIKRVRVSLNSYVEVVSRGDSESRREAITVLRNMRESLMEFCKKDEEETPKKVEEEDKREKAEEEQAPPEKKAKEEQAPPEKKAKEEQAPPEKKA